MTEHDLATLLRELRVTKRPGAWCMVSGVELPGDVDVQASLIERRPVPVGYR